MTRPAEPGEVGILIQPSVEGFGVGSRLLNLGRCVCWPDECRYRAVHDFRVGQSEWCYKGEMGCLKKSWVIVLEDPDKGSEDSVEKEKQDAGHV